MAPAHARAGRSHKARLLDPTVELFGYHRKAAVRALRALRARLNAIALRREVDWRLQKIEAVRRGRAP